MKLNNILKTLALMLISSGLYAQDFYSYKLFDNKFQAIFPGQPIKNKFIYSYKDIAKNITFTAISLPASQSYDVKEYNKKSLDDSQKDALKFSTKQLIDFSSILNRNQNLYTYEATVKTDIGYTSIKYIVHKKTIYRWAVIYNRQSDKYIFDNYKKHCKVIK